MYPQQATQNDQQIIKTREDPKPIVLGRLESEPVARFKLNVADDVPCSWAKDKDEIGPEQLRPRIEPWLTALAQSEHLSLLIGSGLTHAVHKLATGDVFRGWMETIEIKTFADVIKNEAEHSAKMAGRGTANFEDQLRVANELIRGLEIIISGKNRKTIQNNLNCLQRELTNALETFASSILEAERNLASAPDDQRKYAFNYLVGFLMSLQVEPAPANCFISSQLTMIAISKRVRMLRGCV